MTDTKFPVPPDDLIHNILLVEDDSQISETLTIALQALNYRVTIARDGGQTQSSFVRHRPDIILLDLILPGESGFEICERIKTQDPHLPILVISAMDRSDARDLAGRVGADGYLTKPFDIEQLVEMMINVAEQVWNEAHTPVSAHSDKRIKFTCSCKKKFKVSYTHRGRVLSCPQCGEQLTVPMH